MLCVLCRNCVGEWVCVGGWQSGRVVRWWMCGDVVYEGVTVGCVMSLFVLVHAG